MHRGVGVVCAPSAGACAQVFYGLELRQGDRILTSQHEYSSNFTAFLQARRAAAPAAPHACHALVLPGRSTLSSVLWLCSLTCSPALSLVFARQACKLSRPEEASLQKTPSAQGYIMHSAQCLRSCLTQQHAGTDQCQGSSSEAASCVSQLSLLDVWPMSAIGTQQLSLGCAGGLQVGRRTGAVVEVIPEEPDGEISTDGLEALIVRGRPPALVAITHVPTNCGWALLPSYPLFSCVLHGGGGCEEQALCREEGQCARAVELTPLPELRVSRDRSATTCLMQAHELRRLCRRVYDAAAVGAVTRRHGIPFLLDACQARPAVQLERAMLEAVYMYIRERAGTLVLCIFVYGGDAALLPLPMGGQQDRHSGLAPGRGMLFHDGFHDP